MKYIDIHGHMNFAAYEADRAEVIKRALDAGVAMISVGTQLDTSKAAIQLAHEYDSMYAKQPSRIMTYKTWAKETKSSPLAEK